MPAIGSQVRNCVTASTLALGVTKEGFPKDYVASLPVNSSQPRQRLCGWCRGELACPGTADATAAEPRSGAWRDCGRLGNRRGRGPAAGIWGGAREAPGAAAGGRHRGGPGRRLAQRGEPRGGGARAGLAGCRGHLKERGAAAAAAPGLQRTRPAPTLFWGLLGFLPSRVTQGSLRPRTPSLSSSSPGSSPRRLQNEVATGMNVSDEVEQLFPPFNFEQSQDLRPFLEEYWATSFLIVLIYLLLIIVGQNYMKARKGYSLQRPLALWSFCLAVFSILGTVRMWGFMGIVFRKGGLKQTVCFSIFTNNSTVRFWSCLFLLSKIIELGDTAFIILRKRPLVFIHWFHHSTVLLYTSFGYKNKVAAGGWFVVMNFGVHAIMYTYYTLKAARMKSPRMFSMVVTILQILQMFLGAIFSMLAYIWRQEKGCHMTMRHFFWSIMLYVTYFILFARFFHQSYIMPKIKGKTKNQ
ncbi:very long chain fatty acid elongase 3 [Dasypus novemcinctus]|uniref:very long chain fatty acid elongase 3 n=1 Tax=Dasypus novemcinctus TaxID=9361 RepID=UPI0039C8CE14